MPPATDPTVIWLMNACRVVVSGRNIVWWMDGVTISAAVPLGGDGRVALLRRPGRAVG